MKPHHLPLLFAALLVAASPAAAEQRSGVLKRDARATTVTLPTSSSSMTTAHASQFSPPGGPPYSNQTTTASSRPESGRVSSTTSSTATPTDCIPVSEGKAATTISVTHTWTTTFYGNSTDYTPPYPTLSTKPYCAYPVIGGPERSGSVSQTLAFPSMTLPASPKVTFVTTDKNPSVVISPGPTPAYSGTEGGGVVEPSGKATVRNGWPNNGPPRTNNGNMHERPLVSITAGSGFVAIGSSTFSHLQPDQTTTVTVDDDVYTIHPTQIIGGGTTVTKPSPVLVPEPTTATDIGGIPVSASDSVVNIGDQTITVPPQGTSIDVDGHEFSVGPGAVVADSADTLSWAVPTTDIVVAGGELVTATGPTVIVIHSTTITYGPGISPKTTTLGEDVVTISPNGVTVGTTTLGGPDVPETYEDYEVVGGVTVTQLGTTAVRIRKETYPVTSGADNVTTTIGGLVLTIGPGGVSLNSMTIAGGGGHDDENAVTFTLTPHETISREEPTNTGSASNSDDDDDDAAPATRPTLFLGGICVVVSIFLHL